MIKTFFKRNTTRLHHLCILILAFLMMFPTVVMATAMNYDEEDRVVVENTSAMDVAIPMSAKCVTENGEPIYYDFYDSENHYTYAYYAPESGSYFRISDPIEMPITEDDLEELELSELNMSASEASRDSRIKKVVHKYSFEGDYTINGNSNGITFSIPETPDDGRVYLSGRAKIIHGPTGEDHTSNYGTYNYTITLVRKVLFGYTKTMDCIAGKAAAGYFGSCKSGTHYLIVQPGSKIHTPDTLCPAEYAQD